VAIASSVVACSIALRTFLQLRANVPHSEPQAAKLQGDRLKTESNTQSPPPAKVETLSFSAPAKYQGKMLGS
jgi:hypothetical protein